MDNQTQSGQNQTLQEQQPVAQTQPASEVPPPTPADPSPPSLPPTTSAKPSSRNWKKWSLVGLVLLVVVIIGGGTFVLSQQKSQEPKVVSTAKPTTSPSPTPDPTADWKTYINTKVGFQLRFPERYGPPSLPSGTANAPLIYASGQEVDDNIIFGTTSLDGFSLRIFPYSGILNDLPHTEQAKSFPFQFSDPEYITLSIKDHSFNNINNHVLVAFDKTRKADVAIFFLQNGYGLILAQSGSNSNPINNAKEINQILQTFKFTEQPTQMCIPRPACLDADPPCLMPEPANMCPKIPTACPAAPMCKDGEQLMHGDPGPDSNIKCPIYSCVKTNGTTIN